MTRGVRRFFILASALRLLHFRVMAHGRRQRDSIAETPDVSYITNPDVAHEESDVAVRPLLWFVGGLTFFTIVVCLAMLLMFKFFQGREESQEVAAGALGRQG